jgi:hypothetical protein
MNAPARNSVDAAVLAARSLALFAGLSLPLAFGAASYAQPAPQGADSAPAAAARHRSPEEMAAARAARLRALLQLRPDQEPALTAFLASMKPVEAGVGREHEDRAAEETLSAPERMERMLAHMDKVRAEMGQKLDALKTFYGQLTPAQQKAFDVLDMRHGHSHQHRGMAGRAG